MDFLFSMKITHFLLVRVEWTKDSGGRWKMEEVPGSEKFFPAQLVFLALGFLGPQSEALKALGVKQDARSNVQTPPKVCSCLYLSHNSILIFVRVRNILQTSMASLLLAIVVVGNPLSSGVSSKLHCLT